MVLSIDYSSPPSGFGFIEGTNTCIQYNGSNPKLKPQYKTIFIDENLETKESVSNFFNQLKEYGITHLTDSENYYTEYSNNTPIPINKYMEDYLTDF